MHAGARESAQSATHMQWICSAPLEFCTPMNSQMQRCLHHWRTDCMKLTLTITHTCWAVLNPYRRWGPTTVHAKRVPSADCIPLRLVINCFLLSEQRLDPRQWPHVGSPGCATMLQTAFSSTTSQQTHGLKGRKESPATICIGHRS
jgi:hypothetical protein